MASQVLSGSSNPSYTNNTGQNVRVVINFMRSSLSNNGERISINWAGISAKAEAPIYNKTGSTSNSSEPFAIGRNLASITFYADDRQSPTGTVISQALTSSLSVSNAGGAVPIGDRGDVNDFSLQLPTELMLAPGQTFSATCGVYNIVVIPEAG